MKCFEVENGTASATKSTTKVLKKRAEGLEIESFIETKMRVDLDVFVSDERYESLYVL